MSTVTTFTNDCIDDLHGEPKQPPLDRREDFLVYRPILWIGRIIRRQRVGKNRAGQNLSDMVLLLLLFRLSRITIHTVGATDAIEIVVW